MTDQLADKLKALPNRPGVYFHKSVSGEVIYVGKAANLRQRVRQYFQASRLHDVKTDALIAEIDDIEWIEVESEIDALFLESEMVKRYLPRYNVLLRDDKSQIYIRIDMFAEWPTVTFTRNPLDDKARYFGPYYNGYTLKKALRYLRRVFPYYIKTPSDRRRDLDTHIGLSPGSDMTSREYKSSLRRLIRYIEGGRVAITREIEREMARAARDHKFEDAAQLRDKLHSLKELQQRIMFKEREFFDIAKDKSLRDLKDLLGLSIEPTRIEGYDVSHMAGRDVVASMVVFTNGVSDRSEYRKFKMSQQKNDDCAHMYETIKRRFSQANLSKWRQPDMILIDGGKGQLEAAIRAAEEAEIRLPIISVAKREEELIIHKYRSYVGLQVLQSFLVKPEPSVRIDDAGDYYTVNLHAGQRNAGAHSRNLRAGSVVGRFDDITKLIQRIRDESHRFAVSYHTTLKRARQTTSLLDTIPSVGLVTKKKLLKQYGSVRGIREASERDLAIVVGPSKAKVIYAALH